MTERSLLQRARPARLALCFVTIVAALAGAALVTAAPAAALSPGCVLVNTFQGTQPASMSAPNTFEAGERLTWHAGPPTSGGTPTGMAITGAGPAGTTISLFTGFPGTLAYDFPLTGFYGLCAARLRGEGWPAALFQAATVALIGGFLIAFKALVH